MRWISAADNSEFSPTSYSFETSDLCALNAESMTGPFFIPGTLVRRNIAEGHPGIPLRLRLKVVDVAGCRALPGAAVEIWHCDASGVYSGYPSFSPDEIPMISPNSRRDPSDEKRFSRGIQFGDASGFVEFETIIPGWYAPRTPHIHVRVSKPGEIEKEPDE